MGFNQICKSFSTAKESINKMKENIVTGRKDLQMVRLTRAWFPKYKNISYNSITKKQTNRKMGKGYESFLQRQTDGQQATSLTLRETEIKITVRYITSYWSGWPLAVSWQTINVGQCVEKREPFCTASGNVNWCSHYGKKHGGSLKN